MPSASEPGRAGGMMEAPTAAVARFAADLVRLWPEGTSGVPLALAVSGGPDSMAMLALAAKARPGAVVAATVDHRLRAGSAEEAVMVAGACAELGVAHATLTVAGAPPPTGNRHAWARRERYRLLAEWAVDHGAAALATAHHADDQAETFLMRAARGAGVAGLAGVRARIDGTAALPGGGGGMTILRPLLGWRRAELHAVVVAAGLPLATDPSNADPRYARTRMREWLHAAPWLDTTQIAASAAHLAELEVDLERTADLLWRERRRPLAEGQVAIDIAGLPRGLCRMLLRRALVAMGEDGARLGNPESLLAALLAGGSGTHAAVWGQARGTVWRFRLAPPRRTG